MSKLSLDALRERAEATTSKNLLATISGGTENACHDSITDNIRETIRGRSQIENEMYKGIGEKVVDWWNGLWN